MELLGGLATGLLFGAVVGVGYAVAVSAWEATRILVTCLRPLGWACLAALVLLAIWIL